MLQHGVFVFGTSGTPPSRAYFVGERGAVLSLWPFLLISKISQKGTKEKISVISPGKIKSEIIGMKMRARLYRSDKL